jgi:hypothetical protein
MILAAYFVSMLFVYGGTICAAYRLHSLYY